MNKRLLFIIVLTIIISILFLFIPQLNILGHGRISMLDEFKQGLDVWQTIINWLVQVIMIFIALFFLIGLKSTKQIEEEDKKKDKDSDDDLL